MYKNAQTEKRLFYSDIYAFLRGINTPNLRNEVANNDQSAGQSSTRNVRDMLGRRPERSPRWHGELGGQSVTDWPGSTGCMHCTQCTQGPHLHIVTRENIKSPLYINACKCAIFMP